MFLSQPKGEVGWMLNKALEHAHASRERYLAELFDFLRIPSISTLSEHRPDIQQAAEWVAAKLAQAGLGSVQVMPTDGNPVVYGEWLGAGPGAPTVLVYGHYDVQPVDPLDLWDSPPFEPQVRGGEVYARGASDDKGQMYIHVKAVESLLAVGEMPVNVKMIFEGEEEIGSANLEPFVLAHTDLLAATSALISDGRIITPEQPSIVYALRGMAYMELRVKGPKRDLHSGSYGGTVHNPAQALAEIVTGLHDGNGTVTIPGFYDKVRPLSAEERAALKQVPYTVEQWQGETGLRTPWGEPDFTLLERIGARPTCEVNGIWGGFQGEGGKTVIPAQAGAKISMRLVADQDPHEIARLFIEHVRRVAPPGVEVEALKLHTAWPAITPIGTPVIQAAASAYEATWGVPPVFAREGGSIPIVAAFQNVLNAPVVLMGFGLDDNVHSPNEHFCVEHFYRGIDTVMHYYHNLAADV
jgi:acetylornithine deacetylase/succinyl-diaminopimelate desuccinylase-like protein